jgi:asparagine synthase (glutamine-hydrolysing)
MLVKVDRASMAVSLEVRAVFLHRDMLALAGRIPADRLLHDGIPKHALKHALRAWLPDDLLFRRKRGFTAPVGRWMRADGTQPAAPEATVQRGLDEYIDPALLGGLRRDHARSDADRSRAIGNVETLADWLDSWR